MLTRKKTLIFKVMTQKKLTKGLQRMFATQSAMSSLLSPDLSLFLITEIAQMLITVVIRHRDRLRLGLARTSWELTSAVSSIIRCRVWLYVAAILASGTLL